MPILHMTHEPLNFLVMFFEHRILVLIDMKASTGIETFNPQRNHQSFHGLLGSTIHSILARRFHTVADRRPIARYVSRPIILMKE